MFNFNMTSAVNNSNDYYYTMFRKSSSPFFDYFLDSYSPLQRSDHAIRFEFLTRLSGVNVNKMA